MGSLDDRAEVAVGMVPRDGDWEKERAATIAAAEAAGADPAQSGRMLASFDRRVKQLPASMKDVPRMVLGTRMDVSATLPHDQSHQVQAYPEERCEEAVFRTVSPPCAFCFANPDDGSVTLNGHSWSLRRVFWAAGFVPGARSARDGD